MDKTRLKAARAALTQVPATNPVAVPAVPVQQPPVQTPPALQQRVPVRDLDPLAFNVLQSLPKLPKSAPVTTQTVGQAPAKGSARRKVAGVQAAPVPPAVTSEARPGFNTGAFAGAGLAIGGALVMLGGLVRGKL
jgi:hypothetical protein